MYEASSYRLNGGSSGLFPTLFVFVCDSSCVQCHALMGLCHNDSDSDSDSDSGTCAPLMDSYFFSYNMFYSSIIMYRKREIIINISRSKGVNETIICLCTRCHKNIPACAVS